MVKSEQQQTKKEVDSLADKYILALEKNLYGFNDYNELSPQYLNLFNLLMAKIRNKNIEAALILCPYHPKVYKFISERYPMVAEVEKYIKRFAAAHNLKVYGSYDPTILGLNASHFSDGAHVWQKAQRIILKQTPKGQRAS